MVGSVHAAQSSLSVPRQEPLVHTSLSVMPSYSRAQLSKSSGAWLDATDTVFVPLMHEGEYQVVLRLRAGGVSVPVVLGNVKIEFPPGIQPVARVVVDPGKLNAGLAKLATQKAAAARKAAARKAAARKASAGKSSRSRRRRR